MKHEIKFDVLSSEPKSKESKGSSIKQHSRKCSEQKSLEQNMIDKIVKKHIGSKGPEDEEKLLSNNMYQYSNPKFSNEQDEASLIKSGSLVSFEYNNQGSEPKFYNQETPKRNESYEIMELNSFNEIKGSDEAEDKYHDAGLYGVFNQALENNVNFYEKDPERVNTLNDFEDSMEVPAGVFESDQSESNLSPRSRQVYKITKAIKENFKENSDCHNTTKEFYKIGK